MGSLRSLAALRDAYASGGTVAQVARACLAAADAGDPAIWVDRVPTDEVLAQAARLDALLAADRDGALARLPLLGVPVAVKGNIDVVGLPTTAACPAFATVPDDDAVCVARLRAAGALVVGTTNLDQFATGLVGTRSPYGVPRNTVDARLVPGGSSSGSAAAVAAGIVPVALGTDTAGSGRVPAALQEVVGLKPTRGLVSTRGVVPACRSLDCVSVFAGSVADARAVLAVVAGDDPGHPWSRPARPAPPATGRVGVAALGPADFDGDTAMHAAWRAALHRLPWPVDEQGVGPLVDAGALLYRGPWVAERLADLGDFLAKHAGDVHLVTRRVLEGGEAFSAVDAFRAQHRLAELAAVVRGWWDHVDAVLLPTVPTTFTLDEVAAEPLAHNATLGRFTQHTNLLDLAAVAVPGGRTADGRPVGLMLVGPAFSDDRLADLAAALIGEGAGEAAVVTAATPPATTVAVVGKHLTGQPLNAELTGLGAHLVETATTADRYRLLALPPHEDPLPALVRTAPGAGGGVEVELWAVPDAAVAALVRLVPPRLSLGHVELADGRQVLGFLGEAHAVTDAAAVDVTASGGWRYRPRSAAPQADPDRPQPTPQLVHEEDA